MFSVLTKLVGVVFLLRTVQWSVVHGGGIAPASLPSRPNTSSFKHLGNLAQTIPEDFCLKIKKNKISHK